MSSSALGVLESLASALGPCASPPSRSAPAMRPPAAVPDRDGTSTMLSRITVGFAKSVLSVARSTRALAR